MLFLLCLAATPLATAQGYFYISTYAPQSKIDRLKLDAANEGFHTGLSGPKTGCPLANPSTCPTVLGTRVVGKMEAMAVKVSGGQRIYVHNDGQVKYEKANSSVSPPGEVNGSWTHKATDSSGNEVIRFDDGHGHGGLELCYDDDSKSHATLYAKTKGVKVDLCTDIDGLSLIAAGSSVGCWQYE